IDWNAGGIDFFMDRVKVASHNTVITADMHPIVSDFTAGGADLSVDSLRLTPITGRFTSRVFDGGGPGGWTNADWTSDTPAGSGVALSVRTGDTPVPDGTWTAFAPVSGPGGFGRGAWRY